ncbi:hypothetical protein E2A64_10615 [Pseudohoeflea suaedae]|uniref:Uncharacterized protein n=1 Tax=Pseudohoeflea suaedae TaxID=877384 RepID=A0A4R5PJD2_9HYPH|nr:hypothetical protein [Pseudohoeflea suaedae]TDH35773.1 hypothetical protein E2A64_10615 [Pseudohoeflea suaedae]
MLKGFGFTLATGVFIAIVLKFGIFQDSEQFSRLNQTLQTFLIPIILLVAALGMAFAIIGVKAPHLLTTRRINLFTWISGAVLAATFLIAVAYTKLVP